MDVSVKQPRQLTRGRSLTIMFVAVAVVWALWNIDALSPIAYPFRLFVTYVHEAGHSIMAILTGGKVIGFTVSSDGSGLATTAGGNRPLILMAGYLGAALFGAALFYIVNVYHRSKTISVIIGFGIVMFTVMYARPDDTMMPIALFVGMFAGVMLVSIGLRAPADVNQFVLNIFALMTALNAVFDIFYLTRINSITGNVCDTRTLLNDAAAFSCEVAPAIPPTVWALLWAGIALLMMAASVYYSVLRPFINTQFEKASARKEAEEPEFDFSQFV